MRLIMRKLIIVFRFVFHHLLFEVLSGSFQHVLDLSNGNNREVFSKEEVTGEEQAERSEIETNLWPGWAIVAPAGWKVIAVQ